MSSINPSSLLSQLEDLQKSHMNSIDQINKYILSLSHAILTNNNLNETVNEIKLSSLITPKSNIEEENKSLKEEIRKLKNEIQEHKISYHCLKTTTPKSPRQSHTSKLLIPKELSRSFSNKSLQTKSELTIEQQIQLSNNIKQLDLLIEKQKDLLKNIENF